MGCRRALHLTIWCPTKCLDSLSLLFLPPALARHAMSSQAANVSTQEMHLDLKSRTEQPAVPATAKDLRLQQLQAHRNAKLQNRSPF